jgi:hypothetical protein
VGRIQIVGGLLRGPVRAGVVLDRPWKGAASGERASRGTIAHEKNNFWICKLIFMETRATQSRPPRVSPTNPPGHCQCSHSRYLQRPAGQGRAALPTPRGRGQSLHTEVSAATQPAVDSEAGPPSTPRCRRCPARAARRPRAQAPLPPCAASPAPVAPRAVRGRINTSCNLQILGPSLPEKCPRKPRPRKKCALGRSPRPGAGSPPARRRAGRRGRVAPEGAGAGAGAPGTS